MARELNSAGMLAPEELRRIELTFRLRNQIVHGFSPPPSDAGDLDAALLQLLGDLTRRLVSESLPAKQTA